jgi:PAS domain S-box-containing protein
MKKDYGGDKKRLRQLIILCNHILFSVIILVLILAVYGAGFGQQSSAQTQIGQGAPAAPQHVIHPLTVAEQIWLREHPVIRVVQDPGSKTQQNEIYEKWLPIRYEHRFDYMLLWYAVAIFALILSGFAGWKWKLAREIGTRKKAETALVNSEEKFRVVFESANVGKSITLPTGEINVNQALCDMLGYTREELKGKKWQDITAPDEIETTQKISDMLLQGRKDSIRLNKRYVHKNGSYVWADVSIVAHRDFDRKPLFFITTILDITEHKKTEEKMRLVYDHFRRFIDSNIVGIVIATADGKIVETNDYYLSMIGFTREEFESGKVDWRAITPPEWISADEKAIKELRERGACMPYEKEYQRRDGTRVPVFLANTLLPSPEEQIAAFVLDITERKGVENALRESEKKLREVQEMAHLGSWHWDVKTGDVEWSEEVYRIFRLDPNKFTPQIDSILALSPWPEDHQRDKELINRAIETHSPGTYEQKFIFPDKSIGYYYSTFQGNYDIRGDLVSIIGSVMDITERKLAEEELHESVAKLQLTIDEAPIGVVMVGFDKRFLKCNKFFCSFLGYSDEELKEKTIADITFPEDVEIGMPDLHAVLAGEVKSSSVQKRYLRKDGAVVWGEVNINLIRNCQGDPLYFMSIVQDISERKRAEDEIRKLNEDLEQRIGERTAELRETIGQLEEVNRTFVGRELRMAELKERIAELENKT